MNDFARDLLDSIIGLGLKTFALTHTKAHDHQCKAKLEDQIFRSFSGYIEHLSLVSI